MQLQLELDLPTSSRVRDYMQWWALRPSRWASNLRNDYSEANLDDLPGADLFRPDAEAHEESIVRGYLVRDPRQGCAAWQLTDAGRLAAA